MPRAPGGCSFGGVNAHHGGGFANRSPPPSTQLAGVDSVRPAVPRRSSGPCAGGPTREAKGGQGRPREVKGGDGPPFRGMRGLIVAPRRSKTCVKEGAVLAGHGGAPGKGDLRTRGPQWPCDRASPARGRAGGQSWAPRHLARATEADKGLASHRRLQPLRRCSSRRGMISTKLQGRWRLSSCHLRMSSHASLHAPGEPGRQKI